MPVITIIDELENYPFCGSYAVQHEEQDSVIIRCTKCGAGMVGIQRKK